ncbi:MAG: hypothetical protein AAFQ98_04975 [Bacteroidota bacterium]
MSTKPDKIVLAASDWLPRHYSLIGVNGKVAVITRHDASEAKVARSDFESHMRQANPDVLIDFFQDVTTAQSWLGED